MLCDCAQAVTDEILSPEDVDCADVKSAVKVGHIGCLKSLLHHQEHWSTGYMVKGRAALLRLKHRNSPICTALLQAVIQVLRNPCILLYPYDGRYFSLHVF